MSTSYYLKRKPSMAEINELKSLIDTTINGENYREVLNMVQDIYGTADHNSDKFGEILIGHRAAGWQFAWAPNLITEFVRNEDDQIVPVYHTLYPLTKQGILDFIMNDQYIIVDEYGQVQDKVSFMEMALNWEKRGYDCNLYYKEYPNRVRLTMTNDQEPFKKLGYQFDNIYQSDFKSDGLRFNIF